MVRSISLTKLHPKLFSSLSCNNYHLGFGGQCPPYDSNQATI